MSDVETEVQEQEPAAVAEVEAGGEQVETPSEPEQQFDPQAAIDELRNEFGGQYQEIVNYLQSLQPQGDTQPQMQQEEVEFDPFDPNSVKSVVAQVLDERLGPLTEGIRPIIEDRESEQAARFVEAEMERLKVPDEPIEGVEVGGQPVTHRDLTLLLSAGFRYQGLPPSQAIAQANRTLNLALQAAEKKGRAGQTQELETIRQQTEPINGNGTQLVTNAQPRPRSMEEAARRIAAEMGITQ